MELTEQNKLHALLILCILSILIFITTQATVDMYNNKKENDNEKTYNGWYISLSLFSSIAAIAAGIFANMQYNNIKTTEDLAMYKKAYLEKKNMDLSRQTV